MKITCTKIRIINNVHNAQQKAANILTAFKIELGY